MSASNSVDVVTLLWDIENINELFTFQIESPVFLSNSLDQTRWKMCLYPKGRDDNSDDMSFSLTRCNSSVSEVYRIILDAELSIMDDFGESSLVSKHIKKHGFIKDHSWSPCKAFVSREDVFHERRTNFIPYNVLHVRCRLWKSFNDTTLPELITSQTKIERSHFIWKIENFSRLKDQEVKKIHVKTPFSGSPILSYRFYIDEIYDEAKIGVRSINVFELSIRCEVTPLKSTGEQFDSEAYNFTLNGEFLYERCLTLSLSHLLNNKTLYLPMDALSLRIDSFYWSNDVNFSPLTITNMQMCGNVPTTEKSDCLGIAENFMPSPQKSLTETKNTTVCQFKPEKSCEKENCDVNPDTHQNLERFVQDMHGMYEEGLLSDFTLCSGNRTFPVHKNVLSARSPVFKAMFTTPLKEKDGKTLDIPDIDADTLHRMLLFAYSSEVSDLEWEDVISLYFAADKYNIGDLKSITSSVLKAKLSVSNVCEILVHADLHEDQDLKCSAMEFIANHDDEILGNDNWKTFQKEHMPLTMEILSVLYTKMKKRLE